MNLFRNSFFSFVVAGLMAAPSVAWAAMDDYKFVKLQALDKSTARTETFVAEVGSTIQYGPLFIKIQSCRKAQPIDKPESVSFLQIWEVPHGAEKSTWIFSGWMFASSPALSAMDHPVYDVWVLDCQNDKNEKTDKAAPTPSVSEPKAQDDLKAVEEPAAKPVQEEDIPVDSEAAPETVPDVPPAIQPDSNEPKALESVTPQNIPPEAGEGMIPAAPQNGAPPPPEANLRPRAEPVFKEEVAVQGDYALGSWAPPE